MSRAFDSDIAFGVSAALWGYLLGILNCRCGGPEFCTCKAGTRIRVDQLILFTHNFDFFRHWSNQLDRLPTNLVNSGKKNLRSGLSYVQLELRPRWHTTGTDHRRVPEWPPDAHMRAPVPTDTKNARVCGPNTTSSSTPAQAR